MYNLVEAIHQYMSIRYEACTEMVDLREIVSQVVSRLAAPEDMEIRIEGRLPMVRCDRQRLSQIFENLLDNAVRYMDKPHGQIVIRGTEEAACWKFSVTDNGPGINEKYHERIFEVYQTLSTKDESESTGMGLSIVKKIVESYFGRIWIDSKLGQGVTFFFTLPKQTMGAIEPRAIPADTAGLTPRESLQEPVG